MIDTHCHLYTNEFDSDIDLVIQRARLEGVTKFYMPAIDKSCTERMNILEQKFPQNCFSMAGLHPCSVKEDVEKELAHVKQQLQQRKFSAIGEAGLDFYWDRTFTELQYMALNVQIELALQYELPLVLHTRNATQETIDVIKRYSHTKLTGIFHCFGGTIEEAEQIIGCNFYLGIGGVVTYKNAGLAEVLQQIDMKHIVLETDAPYLSPMPVRGKRNESSYLKFIVEKIALVKNIPVEDVKAITNLNAEKIFGV